MKQILLTGAAGSIGYETLKQLVEKEIYEITVLELPTKRSRKRLQSFENQVHIVYGSINDEALVSTLTSKMDVVIHLAAIIPPLADQKPELARQVNYFGTKNIVTTIQKENPKCFLLYASSVSVYGDRIANPWIEVSDPLKPSEGDYYALTKIETEQMIRECNIPYAIFRLTGIMGRPDIDPLMFHMPLDTKLEIATTIDTASAFVNAIEKTKELNGHTYNLSGGAECRTIYRDFLIQMFRIYGLNFNYLKQIAFAEKNFHCGYFLDGDKLDDIVHFRYDTLDSYYKRIHAETKKITRFFSRMLSKPILFFLTKKSEPLQAQKKQNPKLLERFFNRKK